MELITNGQKAKTHILLQQLDMLDDKKEIVAQFSGGRTESTRELTRDEAKRLITALNKMAVPTPEQIKREKMQRKIIAMAHECGWELNNRKIDMQRLNTWCISKSYLNKRFDKYTVQELPRLVSQFEKVHDWNLKNKQN